MEGGVSATKAYVCDWKIPPLLPPIYPVIVSFDEPVIHHPREWDKNTTNNYSPLMWSLPTFTYAVAPVPAVVVM